MSPHASSTAAVAPNTRQGQAGTPAVAHARMANAIRALAMDAVEQAKSGHPGLPMGAADVATVLFTQVPEIRSGRSGTGPTATASCSRPATARC